MNIKIISCHSEAIKNTVFYAYIVEVTKILDGVIDWIIRVIFKGCRDNVHLEGLGIGN